MATKRTLGKFYKKSNGASFININKNFDSPFKSGDRVVLVKKKSGEVIIKSL